MFIRVKVTQNAKKESFTPEEGKENRFIASVREKAERNIVISGLSSMSKGVEVVPHKLQDPRTDPR
jgi:hypothetical protein